MESLQNHAMGNEGLPKKTKSHRRPPLRPRSPSHAAKHLTPEDRLCEFGWQVMLQDGRLMCRTCNQNLDHTRRSCIDKHFKTRRHQKALEESSLDIPVPAADNSAVPVSPMVLTEMTGPYLLKKDTHCSTILDQLLRDDTFSDVTLTAEGQSIRAHKIVLCLASAYFRQVLSKESSVQNVIVFRDIKFSELRSLINFIYTGEVSVDAAELDSFMRTAEILEVNSLCDGSQIITNHLVPKTKEAKRKRRLPKPSRKRFHSGNVESGLKARKIGDIDSSSTSKPWKGEAFPSISTEETVPMIVSSESLSGLPLCVIKVEPEGNEGAQAQETRFSPENDVVLDCKIEVEAPGNQEDTVLLPPFDRKNDRIQKDTQGSSSLTSHVRFCHTENTAFICDICSRVFLKKRFFEAHKEECVR